MALSFIVAVTLYYALKTLKNLYVSLRLPHLIRLPAPLNLWNIRCYTNSFLID